MKFPKAVMRSGELVQMGFPRELLRRAYGTKGQRFATKVNPNRQNSTLLFDTAGFAEWLNDDIAKQDRALRRG